MEERINPYIKNASRIAGVKTSVAVNNYTYSSSKGTSKIVSAAEPAINTDMWVGFEITALAIDITSFTTNLTGTPKSFDILKIRITDDGTSRLISWGSKFDGAMLPANTIASTPILIGLMYFEDTAKWNCVSVK